MDMSDASLPARFHSESLKKPRSAFLARASLMAAILLSPWATVLWARDPNKPFEDAFPVDFPTIDQLSFTDVSNQTIPGEELLGQAVAIVVFLPTCPKCTAHLPKVEEARRLFEEEGVKIVAIPSANAMGAFRDIARTYPYEWLWATNASEIRKSLHSSRTFEVFLFDREGRIRFQFLETDSKWSFHLEVGLGSVCERALDLSTVSRGYTGSMVCGMCHVEEWMQWLTTPHATSMETLRRENSFQRIECIRCHLTGEAGKPTRPWRVAPKDIQEIGCEECHGPGGPHRTVPHPDAALHDTTEASCIRCHDQQNSPNWIYKEYLAKVVHTPAAETEEPAAETEEPAAEEKTPPEPEQPLRETGGANPSFGVN